ncbi:MAG TPA: amino acid ABC transporter substrate-binding protein [Thermoprotei archaeon]|nr:amino acid ABC transporter substrate-binding protein [Thermoprotei archaeon]
MQVAALKQLVIGILIGIVIGSGVLYGLASAEIISIMPSGVVKKLPKEIPIGVLLPLQGPLSTYGNKWKYAVQMAFEDVNNYVKLLGYDITFKPLIEDTQVNPELALTAVKNLYSKGVKVIIGPAASSEVKAIASTVNSYKIVVISPSSTAPDLAIPNDFIFRLVIIDAIQGRAIAKLILKHNITKVVVLYRKDDWGQGLFDAFKENFESLGGTVVGIPFDPKAEEFSAEVRQAADALQNIGTGGSGVLLISFEDDGVSVLNTAKDIEILGQVMWFGCDGTAFSGKIPSQVGDFVIRVGGLPSTIFYPQKSVKTDEFRQRYLNEVGEEIDSYGLNIYDCVWVAALSILEAGEYDGEVIKNVLPEVASRYFGVSGWALLDEAGDRIGGGDYIIVKIVQEGSGLKWIEAGTYIIAKDIIEFRE